MSEKKKVALLLPWLKMGGTNKIALHFIKELSQYCEVTLVLSEYTGELLSQLPQGVNLVVDTMRTFKEIFKEDLKKLHIAKLVKDAVYYARIKLKRDNVDNYRYLVQRHGYISDTEFDCAISYHGQSPERLLNLIYRTHAKKKVAWIHGEFCNSQDHYRRMNNYYSMLDHLFFVSHHTKQSFMDKFAVDENRCTVYYNPIDKAEVVEKAKADCETVFDKDYINLLTVGRISSEKGQDMIPQIAAMLIKKGHKLRWYVIGDGDKRTALEKAIAVNKLENSVILLGTQVNPYCYMKSCDIYVQPSYTEGYSTTICEAAMLGKAIVGTKPSGGIYDQITHGRDGFIAEATVDGLSCAIEELITDISLRHQFEQEILKKNFEGKGEIKKFLAVL